MSFRNRTHRNVKFQVISLGMTGMVLVIMIRQWVLVTTDQMSAAIQFFRIVNHYEYWCLLIGTIIYLMYVLWCWRGRFKQATARNQSLERERDQRKSVEQTWQKKQQACGPEPEEQANTGVGLFVSEMTMAPDSLNSLNSHISSARPDPAGLVHPAANTMWEALADAAGQARPAEAFQLAAQRTGHDRRRHLERAVETMQLGVTITDLDGLIIYTNPAEANMHGYAVDELIGKDLGILAPAELRQPLTPEQLEGLNGGLRESVNVRKDGSIFPVRLLSDIIKDEGGIPIAIVKISEDITNRRRGDYTLSQRNHELAVLNQMSELLQACHEEEDTYRVVTSICQQLFSADSGCLSIMDQAQTRLQMVRFWGHPPEGSPTSETDVACRIDSGTAYSLEHGGPGALCPCLRFSRDKECLCVPISSNDRLLGILSLCPRQNRAGSGESGERCDQEAQRMLLTRVAEQYALSLANLRLRETLRMESIRDPLTGLYNRRYMEESLAREARRAHRHHTAIGIIMLDIDFFKQVNDQYGHEVGDRVLQKLGLFFQQYTRGEDIACRYGGEEFLVILPEASLQTVVQRAEELRTNVKYLRVTTEEGTSLRITISAGLAVLPDHSAQVKDVVKIADNALYQAKHNGRDQVMVAEKRNR